MSIVAINSDPDDSTPKARMIQLPSRDQVTAIQLQSLLTAAHTLNQLLPRVDEDGATVGPHDGGVAAAVETSLIKICARIDSVVDDSARWTLARQAGLEEQLSEVYKTHLAVLQQQKNTLRAMQAPHRQALPTLCRLETGEWAAVLGNPQDHANCIIGVGLSPAEALEDFDNIFNGKQNEQHTLDGSGPATTENPHSGGLQPPRDREDNEPDGDRGPTQV